MHCASFVIVVDEQEMFLRDVPRAKEDTVLRAFHYDEVFVCFSSFFCNWRGLRKLRSRSEVLLYGKLRVRLLI
jgi:hypothetical protein